MSMQQDFSLTAYDYHLPVEQIAQHPADSRENSRLLVLHRTTGVREHKQFHHIIELLAPGDLLVVNNTRVFPARFSGKKESGGKVEVFLLHYPQVETQSDTTVNATASALIKSSRRPLPGSRLFLGKDFSASVNEILPNGQVSITLHFPASQTLAQILDHYGQVPLPPYINRTEGSTEEDKKRYQTVYADSPGAVAAPTAGLHFSKDLLAQISQKGVELAEITLHVGHGTFAPVRSEEIRKHRIHHEFVSVSRETAEKINRVRAEGGKIWAVGTTSVRTLEFMADARGRVKEGEKWCDLYIYPGYQFKVVDNLITNFHLPKSSLLFLVAALCGREMILETYQEAVEQGYRFFSYGDAMVICP